MKTPNMLIATLLLFLSPALMAKPVSIYGEQGLLSVEKSDDEQVNRLADGVCKVTDYEGFTCCSGFFIADDLIMTNYHCLDCVAKRATAEPTLMDMIQQTRTNDFATLNGYDEFSKIKLEMKDPAKKKEGFSKQNLKIKKILAGARKYDFLVLQVERPQSLKPYINTLSDAELSAGMPLLTIGYPAASPFPGRKVYDSTDECVVQQPSVGYSYQRLDNFAHQCDTNGGSSGSPIFDKVTDRVVGLHWAGGARRANPLDATWKESNNLAIPMGAIVDYLKVNHPQIYDRLNVQ